MTWISPDTKNIPLTIAYSGTDCIVPIWLSESSGLTGTNLSAIFEDLGSDANRKKIAVTTEDGVTELYVEIAFWDTANKHALLFTKVTSAPCTLYLHYDPTLSDNSDHVGDTTEAVTFNVWDSGFEAVYHMAQDPNGDGADAIKDSTSNARHMTPGGSMTTADWVAGPAGKAIEFDGSDDILIAASQDLGSTAAITVLQVLSCADWNGAAAQWKTTYYAGDYAQNWFDNLGVMHMYFGDVDGDGTVGIDVNSLADDQFYTFTWRKNSSNIAVYLNDSLYNHEAHVGSSSSPGTVDFSVGAKNDGSASAWWPGKIGEMQISSVERSEEWIKFMHYGLHDELITFGNTTVSGSLSIVNSLQVGSTITLTNSLNLQLSSNLSLVMNITQALSGNLTLKMNINERAEFSGTLSLLNNLLSADSGITHGEYYFLRSHGL